MVTARKPHKCCECGASIPVGTKYEQVDGYWDKWDHYKTCEVCVNTRTAMLTCGCTHGRLREEIMDCYGIDYLKAEKEEE